uniref:Heme-binding protein soul2 n=1 Tax=Anabas testudineus TaxID=64144 RepID=A0A7N5ZXT2_ANATE
MSCFAESVKMKQLLSVLVALVLVLLCKGQDWTPPSFCNGQICPQFKLCCVQDFEVRSYVATEWITTKIQSSANNDLMAAHKKLKEYCQTQKDAGMSINVNTWPALITKKEGSGLSMSWFLSPGTKKPADSDSVRVQSIPEITYYVRVFNGLPSMKSAEENAAALRKALVDAGKTFDPQNYTGAAYDSIMSVTHHNEIWIVPA